MEGTGNPMGVPRGVMGSTRGDLMGVMVHPQGVPTSSLVGTLPGPAIQVSYLKDSYSCAIPCKPAACWVRAL